MDELNLNFEENLNTLYVDIKPVWYQGDVSKRNAFKYIIC